MRGIAGHILIISGLLAAMRTGSPALAMQDAIAGGEEVNRVQAADGLDVEDSSNTQGARDPTKRQVEHALNEPPDLYHKRISTKDETLLGHKQTSGVLADDPMCIANRMVSDLQDRLMAPIGLTFTPSIGWTYQHASKVRDGLPQGRSYLWYGWSGEWTAWKDHDGSGRVVYSVGGNTGLGTSTFPLLGEELGDPDYANNVLVPNRIGLYLLYWDQNFLDNRVSVRVGKFEDQIFFDQNTIAYDPITGFLSENLTEQIVMPFPNYSFGANVHVQVTDDLRLRAGTMNSADSNNNSGFEGLSSSHLFTVGEADLTVNVPINGVDRTGHWRFSGWYNSMPNPFGAGDVEGGGICFNMDQEVSDQASIFMRLGWGENHATRSNFAISGGFAIESPFGLKHNHTGFGLQYAKITAVGQSEVDLSADPGELYLAEWYWRVDLSRTLYTGPVIQVWGNSSASVDTSVVWGWRTSWVY